MGNSPTQKPYEGDASKPGTDGADTLSGRVVSAVRSIADTVRRRCSVFSNLDFGGAFHVEDRITGPSRDRSTASENPDSFPQRERPFTQPVRNRNVSNPPDLRADEDDETLSIYYPDQSGATITSDTWQRVER